MKKYLLAGLFVAISGCSTQSFVINDTYEPTSTEETMQPFFVSGLGQTQEIDAVEICDGAENIAKVETRTSFLNVVLGTLSSGLYTPRQATVYCMR